MSRNRPGEGVTVEEGVPEVGTPCSLTKPSHFSRQNQESFLMPPSLPPPPPSNPSPSSVDLYLPNSSDIHPLLSISTAPSRPSITTFSLDLSILALLVFSLHSRQLGLFQTSNIFLCYSSLFLFTFSYFSVLWVLCSMLLGMHVADQRVEKLVFVFQKLKPRGEEEASVEISVWAKNGRGLPLTSWQGPQKGMAHGLTRQAGS